MNDDAYWLKRAAEWATECASHLRCRRINGEPHDADDVPTKDER